MVVDEPAGPVDPRGEWDDVVTDTPPAVGFITLAALAAADVERLVCKYNDGKPFQPIGAGVMVPGRRKGE